MENVFKNFNENFFKSKKGIRWYDQDGLYKLDDTRVVSITLDDIGVHENFNGYTIVIHNTQNGGMVKKFFKFVYHLDMIDRNEREKYSHVWYSQGKLDWYISRPKDTKQMVDVIFDWIEKFK
jgi:hypothetical protein